LKSLYTIEPNPKNITYLTQLEVFFMIPSIILQLNNELTGPISEKAQLEYSVEEILKMFDEKQNVEGSTYDVDYNKLKQLLKFIGKQENVWSVLEFVRQNKKLCDEVNNFKLSDIDQPITLKYDGKAQFDEIIGLIAANQDIKLQLGEVEIKMMGSLFKPRGHYTESLELKKYFMAFTWLSTFDVTVNDKKNSVDELLLGCLIAKIAESESKTINEIQQFIANIIGESDGYSLNLFLELINKHIPQASLSDTINWLLDNKISLWENIMKEDYKTPKLGKFGDYIGDNHNLSFSLFGKGTQIDNTIISKFIDDELETIDDNDALRKFVSIYDLVYTLFGNRAVYNEVTDRMKNIHVSQRDGYQYYEYLEKIALECEKHVFDDTLYAQELKMLRALVADKQDVHPFNTIKWGKKQAKTQIAHYAELRHDNCLYVEEVCGGLTECDYPDLVIEPVPTFWKEMLTLVTMMKKLVKAKSQDEMILNNFSDIISTFLTYLDLISKGKPIDEKMIEKLKCVIQQHFRGSGGPDYGGWYLSLFHDKESTFVAKPEVSSYFTGMDDERGPGGILHLGTGPVNLMYILMKDQSTQENKILLGPSYSAYEFITDYKTRLNDDEWAKQIENYQQIE
jgi:hypothetical protein